MLLQIGTTTFLLAAAALVSKFAAEPGLGGSSIALELMRACLHWRDLAQQDTDAVLRLQHAATAAAYLQASRRAARDADLERACGLDVARLEEKLEAAVADARELLNARKTPSSA